MDSRRAICGTRAELLFEPGALTITQAAWDALTERGHDPLGVLRRHCRGDWSGLSEQDRAANIAALRDGGRVFSSYGVVAGLRVWIITEADRTRTTILLPGEY